MYLFHVHSRGFLGKQIACVHIEMEDKIQGLFEDTQGSF